MTPDGEVYGFVAPNGDIYLDETKINPEHPIHEYTHLWDRIVAKKMCPRYAQASIFTLAVFLLFADFGKTR